MRLQNRFFTLLDSHDEPHEKLKTKKKNKEYSIIIKYACTHGCMHTKTGFSVKMYKVHFFFAILHIFLSDPDLLLDFCISLQIRRWWSDFKTSWEAFQD